MFVTRPFSGVTMGGVFSPSTAVIMMTTAKMARMKWTVIIQSAQTSNLSARTSDALAKTWSAMEKTIVEMATKQMKSNARIVPVRKERQSAPIATSVWLAAISVMGMTTVEITRMRTLCSVNRWLVLMVTMNVRLHTNVSP